MKSEREWVELSAYLDGELTPAERAQVEQRLSLEPSARKALQSLERTQSLIATTMEDIDLTVGVQQRVNALETPRSTAGNRYLVPGVLAAVVLVTAAAGISWLGGLPSPAVDPDAPGVEAPGPEPALPETPMTAQPTAPAAPESPAAPEETLPEAVFAPEPPVEDYFDLPEARVPYALLAVDTEARPPHAYIRLARDDGVARIVEGGTMPDGSPLGWAGADGVILGAPGEWRRVDAPDETMDSLTGWWRSYLYRGDAFADAAVLRVSEASGGQFVLHANGADLEGARAGSRLEVAGGGGHPPMTGEVTRGFRLIELSGAHDGVATTFRLERMSNLDRARHLYSATEWERGDALIRAVRNALAGFLRDEQRMPSNWQELLAGARTLTPEQTALFEEMLFFYEPVPFPVQAAPPLPADAADDPNAAYAYELEMTAAYGMEAPVPLPVLELYRDELGHRFGIHVQPSGAPAEWNRGPVDPGAPELWMHTAGAASQRQLEELGRALRGVIERPNALTPGGWWGVYHQSANIANLLTHPLDEPGTLSYDFLLPATNIDEFLEDLFGEEALEDPAERRRLRGELPLVAENRAFSDPPGRHVLFADGHVDWLAEHAYQQLLREWLR